MTERPRISVVIPVRDDAGGVERCLAALAEQTIPADEIIVVDDHSTDDVTARVSMHAAATLVRSPGRGSYAARNAGVRASTGAVLAFTDADCIPEATWLASALRHLDDDASLGAVAGRVTVTVGTTRAPTAVELHQLERAFPQERYVFEHGFGVTANLLVRRDAGEAAGWFDDALLSGGDFDFGRRLARAGWSVGYADDAAVEHPARATLPGLLRKVRRVAAGRVLIDRGDGTPSRSIVWRAVKDAAPPVRMATRALRGNPDVGRGRRLAVVAVEASIRLVHAQATIAAAVRARGRRGSAPGTARTAELSPARPGPAR